ncbi:MAG: dihydrolipoyllysine-residue acetyltransferase [Halomonas sp.]|uniref:dihydrolipoyllysine-residue acetyltransferase n=1 Tax=Halomonas sp. TaxID=1486246 RepID=UPI001858A39F|nr:dihydrolipoyllysine-residue acetyltransferase [Halomonas sp.]NWN82048.1 dihydrolipoyllysine-residue acetyltransferase [Halomonas sp.]
MSSEIIKVPDIGGDTDVEIIEIGVSEGDVIEAEDTLITLESDKASMDVPSPQGGKVARVLVKEGDTVSEGDDIVELEVEGAGEPEPAAEQQSAPAPEKEPEPAAEKPPANGGGKRSVEITVPDLGGDSDVEVIDVVVAEGEEVAAEAALITLESDKASMDVPSPHAGRLTHLSVKEGDTVSEGDVIGTMEIVDEAGGAATSEAPAPSAGETAGGSEASEEAEEDVAPGTGEPQRQEVRVPDLGGASDVPIIEVTVAEGDEVEKEAPLITLESDKASMDVPSPVKGKLVELTVKEGDSISEGDLIGYIETVAATPTAEKKRPEPSRAESPKVERPAPRASGTPSPEAEMAAHKPRDGKLVHAGPAVRMLARELGVDLALVKPGGPKGRVLKEDVHAYVKQVMAGQGSAQAGAAAPGSAGSGIPPIPDQDFSQFGEVEETSMGRLMKMGATNLHRSWVNLPHVTQFDEADITELEAFRKSMKAEAEAQGAKLTPLPFLIKACAFALRQYPQFNVSLKSDGDTMVHKKYVHIGIAVDTPDGLMVPVIRDADQKSLIELAKESVALAGKAQSKKLKREEMTGGCFTISSLGSIGGTAFTPIVNAPEVAILGVSKASMKPVWDGATFQPRLMMPLSLSYDHRAVNGADAARFTALLGQLLTDIRRLLM